MKRISLWIVFFAFLAVLGSAQETKRPVFFLRYDGGTKSEEAEDEEESVLDYQRHKITLRIKEQFSDDLTINLYTTSFLKLYNQGSGTDYWYFYLKPNCIWDITDRVRWTTELRSKWKYDFDSGGDYHLDITSLLAKTELTVKLLEQLKIIPSFKSAIDLYENPETVQQIYTAGLRFESRINPQIRLNGRYRVILPVPLGEDKHEFGINLSWDPNK